MSCLKAVICKRIELNPIMMIGMSRFLIIKSVLIKLSGVRIYIDSEIKSPALR